MNWIAVRLPYALTIFLGAFLMFQIQPLVGKIVTAKFGGSAGIWGVCLLFFQLIVLAGYTLTYALNKLKVRWQCIAYSGLLVVSAIFLNIPGPTGWESETTGNIALSLLVVLATHLALPCLMLASISGMLQAWFNLSRLGNPYPLYSLSNVGSLGALLSYPVLIEPNLSLTGTINVWKVLYAALVLLVCPAAVHVFKRNPPTTQEQTPEEESQAPRPAAFSYWTMLGTMGTICLISYNYYLTQDVAPVPLIYVIPLSLYLISFIICFASERYYLRRVFVYLTPLLWVAESLISVLWVDQSHETPAMLWSAVSVLMFIFSFFITCQGELYASRPAPKHLAVFYLAIAFGGALGGVFVNFAAPVIFNTYMERYIVGIFAVVLSAYTLIRRYHRALPERLINYVVVAACCCVLAHLVKLEKSTSPNVLTRERNFFGCLLVYAKNDETVLRNGRILHGGQSKDPEQRRTPSHYYGHGTGLDLLDRFLRGKHPGEPLRYGAIGLGAGTVACYGQAGDSLTFYEIDPKVIAVSKKFFTYVADCPAKVTILPGDARSILARQPPQNFNLLVVDAFNGDAVPVHLLTRECFNLYLKNLAPDGILAMHVSNRFLDLESVVENVARSLGLKAWSMLSPEARYVAISKDPDFKPVVPPDAHSQERFQDLVNSPSPHKPAIGVWTDDYSNILSTMIERFKR